MQRETDRPALDDDLLKVADLDGVREYTEGRKVELWRHHGRLVVRAYNEGGLNATEVDVWDLLDFLKGVHHLVASASDANNAAGHYS